MDALNVRFLYFFVCTYLWFCMETITLSSKFQVVIPKKARKDLGLKAGQKLVVIEKGNSIELVKIGNLEKAKGLVKKTSITDLRDESERFD